MYKLRELERFDLSEVNKWRNDSNLILSLGAPFRYINKDVDQKWYESYLANRNSEIRCAIIEDSSPEEIIGLVSLVSIDWINRTCDFHIMIGDKVNQGKGIGTFAIQQILRHAFIDMNLHRVELGVIKSNILAYKLYKKMGFIEEGVKRSARYKNGIYEDIIIMSILETEWKNSYNKVV